MGQVQYDYSDETVIVTGASSGIGRAIARRFGQAEATVLVADVTPESKDPNATTPTHEAIVDDGGDARFIETDVSNPAAIKSVVEIAREYGGVDVMVNNAGIFQPGDVRNVELEDLDALLSVNVRGVIFGCKIAGNDMIERGVEGSIVNTASISSEIAQGDMVAYEATKGAVKMATRSAAADLAHEGIRVNAVAPGDIVTEIIEGKTDLDDHIREDVPLGRRGFPNEVAAAVLFLASEDAAYVTGESVYVDGGFRIFR